jgi:hypothetical protein
MQHLGVPYGSCTLCSMFYYVSRENNNTTPLPCIPVQSTQALASNKPEQTPPPQNKKKVPTISYTRPTISCNTLLSLFFPSNPKMKHLKLSFFFFYSPFTPGQGYSLRKASKEAETAPARKLPPFQGTYHATTKFSNPQNMQ